ncbi:MAG: nucleoside-diphosphate sugar epimerase/dehydratase [Proteobacteria bacterium]|nr:nucleoside-diphosphate sugar epimerase/dehydratase [Pseudomonadota bacterium]
MRTLLAMLHDFAAAAFAWTLAYLLRFNFEPPPHFIDEMLHTLIWVVPLQSIIFWRFGLYRGLWRYASVTDLRQIFLAVLTAAALIPFVLWMFRISAVIPRSVLVIDPALLLLVMGGSRFIYRLWKEHGFYRNLKLNMEPVLVLGASDAAVGLSKELARSRDWRLVGFLDDNVDKHGRILNGIKVLGALDSLPQWAERMTVKQAIVAMPSASHQVRKRSIEICNQARVKVLTVPSFDDLLSGRVAISQLRAVELDDLLGRDPVQLDAVGLQELFTSKTVLVTGAGGSIGSELCRQIINFKPRTLVMLELSEFALYNMEQELAAKFDGLDIVCLIGDVRDAARLDQVFSEYKPTVVFHAAAYKHVPLMEQHNAWQAIRNNVLGTWSVATAAQRHGVAKFVLISTDKAVNPTNVMGASKRLAEMVCQGLQQSGGTRFIMVRFGNVLGSTGSVIPKFREQIAKGGPITVTHPDITRYFMSIPEAAQLVLQASLMGKGGEIFVLDMGDPVKIVDLANDLIRLSGLSKDDIRIEFTGLRLGEKLYEELLADNEHTLPTPHTKLRIAQAREVDAKWLENLLIWFSAHTTQSDAEVKFALIQWIPEYSPNSNGVKKSR